MIRFLRIVSILAILFVLTPIQSFATHIMGGEITWQCLSDGRYVFRFSVYRDCSGANIPPRGPLVIFNYPNVGQSTTLATQAQYNANPTVDRDISPECRPGGVTFTCAGGDDESVFEYIRESDPVRLLGTPPAQGWIITYDDVARNDNENLQGQEGMTLRAKIFPFSGSLADTCVDNSPTFREEATSLLCLGSAFTYNHNASDVELDSLVYRWARPLDDVNPNFPYNEGSNPTFINYDPGYGSGLPGQNSPFPDQGEDPRNVAAQLDSTTGEISLTSFTSGKFVSVVQVDAYKCGEKVAEIYRELQSNIAANCALNEDPVLRPPFNSFTSYRDTVRAGDLVTFNLQITDFPGPNNPNSDSVFVTATGFQFGTNFTSANSGCANPPCATLTRPLPDSGLFAAPNNTFRWQTDCNHVAFTDGCVSLENTYNFVIRATDDACPIPGQTIATISITVLADSVIQSPLINCVDVLPNGDVDLDWNTTPDPNNSFTAWMIYSATNQNGPYTIIDSVKTYNQTTYTHSGAGADNQRRWYYIRSRSGCKGIVQNVARDTVSTLFVQPTLDQTCVGISWNSLSDPNNPAGSATTYRIFREYPIGTGMNFLQNAAVESFCDNFSACEDSVAYRIELINTVEACTSRSNVIGFRFDRQPQTNFTFPSTTCTGPVNFTNLTTAIGGNITYTWDFGDGSPTSNQINPSHTFTGTGPFTVSLTASTGPGCDSTFTQVVNLGPDVDAGADVSICPGGNVTLGGFPTTSASNPTYSWSPAAGLSSTTVSNPTATPNSTTTYTLVVTDQNSCTSTDQVVVTVNPLPFADAGSNQDICEGEIATLGGSPTGPTGATYQWDNAGTLNDATSPNPTANPTVTTIYNVTVTSGVNCSATDQVTITVDPLPIANAGTDQNICPGSSVTLGTATLPGLTYNWNNSASLTNGTIAQPTATPTVTTTYTLTVTDGNGCTATDQITITVDPLPVVDAGADQAICIGGSATLGGAPTGPAGSTYAWDNVGSLDDATLANPTATPTVTTTYTVTVTDGNGCSNTDQITITVNPLPTVDAGADQTICEGQNATLGGAPTGPAGATYAWDNAASLNDATLANPTATPTLTTTYTVTVTDGNGCSETDQVTITVNPNPDVDAGADQAICVGGSISLGGSPTSTTSGATYSWDNAASLDDATLANPTATPTVTTTYTVTVTHPNGCTATDQIIITVNSLPAANAGVDATICSGSATLLGGSPTGPPASSYSWDNAASLDDATLANPTATPTVSTTYTVIVTDINGCTNSDQVTITVDPLPNVDAGPDRTICDLQSTPIGGSPTSSTVGATFTWNNAASLNDPTAANPVASPRTTTTYTLTVTHPNGCTDTDQVVVNVNPLPTVDAGADQAICIGSSTNLGGSPSGPAGATFAWDNAASLNDATIANPIASPTVTTTYTLTVTDVNGCVNTDQVTITVNPLPIADAGLDQTICEADTVLLGTTANPAYTYAWDNAALLDDNTLAQPSAFPSITTTFTVTVTETATSCTSTDQVVISVLPQPFANAGADDTLCLGESITLGGSPTGPAGASFAWDNAASLNDPTASNPIAAPQITTTYTVTVTDAVNGCTNTAQVTILINPLPNTDVGADQDICLGDSITLGGSPTGPLDATYVWDNAVSLDDASSANPLAFPTDTTTYTVLVTDTNGCVSTDQIVVNVVPAPAIDAGVDQTICLGDSVSLGGAPTGPAGASYDWQPSSGLSDNTVSNPLASPSDTTLYVLTVTASTGCISTDTVQLNVNAVPEANFGVDQTCISDLAAFTDSSTISRGNIVSWTWDFGDGSGTSNLQNPPYQYAAAGSYDVKLRVTSDNACSDSVIKTITINDLPSAIAGPDTSLCIGDTIQIGDQSSFDPSATYAWSPATEISDVNSVSPFVYPLSTTNYFLSVTDQNGCANFDTVEVIVNQLPVVQASADVSVCSFTDVQLNASGADSYLWSPADYLDDPSSASPVARAEKSIEYVVLGTDLNGCENTDTVQVDVFNIDFESYNSVVCSRDSVQLIPILEGDTVGISYNWSPDLGLSGANVDSPMVSPPFTQEYKLTVRNALGCTDVDSILVSVNANANLRFDYVNSARCSGSALEIENNSTNADRFLWKVNGLARTEEYNPKLGINNADTNIITLIGWNQNCSDSIQVVVEPATFEEILQYKGTNVFTPNGDGINDIFDPGFEGEFIGCADFRIYDRWGEKVFDSNIGQYGWDGRTLRGRVAPAGVYYYVIIVAGREVKGSVLLSR